MVKRAHLCIDLVGLYLTVEPRSLDVRGPVLLIHSVKEMLKEAEIYPFGTHKLLA